MTSFKELPSVQFRPAPLLKFPGPTDCNSPAWWSRGRLYLLNSNQQPWITSGPDLSHLGPPVQVRFTSDSDGGRWIEAIYLRPDGTLYGFYHNEPQTLFPKANSIRQFKLTAPRIGVARSRDLGQTWDDLGYIAVSAEEAMKEDTNNYFFGGGNGDFSLLPDPDNEFLFIITGTYHKDPAEQGISLLRIRIADLDEPAGKAWKWHEGKWGQPGLGGRVTPIFPAVRDWHGSDPDVFWGPSVHYNTHLGQYVMLLNRAIDPHWKQEGIYVSFSRDITEPQSWSPPRKIIDGGGWYPQIIGVDASRQETDRLAGRVARFFVNRGHSDSEILFLRPGETP